MGFKRRWALSVLSCLSCSAACPPLLNPVWLRRSGTAQWRGDESEGGGGADCRFTQSYWAITSTFCVNAWEWVGLAQHGHSENLTQDRAPHRKSAAHWCTVCVWMSITCSVKCFEWSARIKQPFTISVGEQDSLISHSDFIMFSIKSDTYTKIFTRPLGLYFSFLHNLWFDPLHSAAVIINT